MKKTILIVLVLALASATEVANGDFVLGEPTNLGPNVNTSSGEDTATLTADGLTLFFNSSSPLGFGNYDIWYTQRTTTEDEWGPAHNLGPNVNSSAVESGPNISPDGLTLYFTSNRSGGSGNWDIWVTTRADANDSWAEPENLGPTVNSAFFDWAPSLSADGLSLYFTSERPGGSGGWDIWVTTRATINDPWGEPKNLGPNINSSAFDGAQCISVDGSILFFMSNRSGGRGFFDAWVTRRATKDDDWETPMNLGSTINTSQGDGAGPISPDGSSLFFVSARPGGFGDYDLWQVSIEPVVDFNTDGIVDGLDMCLMVEHWGENFPLCDIGPTPLGDGIVDVQDLIVLAEHLFEEFPPAQ